jgi:hypothetical protein
MLIRRIFRYLPLPWVVFLIAASLQPRRPVGASPVSVFHHIEHVLIFAATTLVLIAPPRTRRQDWAAASVAACLAFAIELAQLEIYSLPAVEWWDIREDLIGIAAAILLIGMPAIRNLLRPRAKRPLPELSPR